MDLVLRAMLEEFDKGYELLRMIERGKRATANIIDIGIITYFIPQQLIANH